MDESLGPVESVRIWNLNYAGGQILMAFLLMAAGLGMAYFLITGFHNGEITVKDITIKSVVYSALFFLMGIGAILMVRECPLWFELGESLKYRTIFKTNSIPWSDVNSFKIDHESKQSNPLPNHDRKILVVTLKNDPDVRIMITPRNEPVITLLLNTVVPSAS